MYICESCGYVFDECDFVVETHGLASPPYENRAVCPSCGADNFEDFYEEDEEEEDE
jgi:rubredoxin